VYFKDSGSSTSDYYLIIYDDTLETLSAPTHIDDGPDPGDFTVRPVIGFDQSNNYYIAYIDDDLDVKVKKYNSGGTLQNTWKVNNNADIAHSWVHLAMDPTSDLPHVVYDEQDSTSDWDICWSRLEPDP
jgi:hypothetical protein